MTAAKPAPWSEAHRREALVPTEPNEAADRASLIPVDLIAFVEEVPPGCAIFARGAQSAIQSTVPHAPVAYVAEPMAQMRVLLGVA